MDNIDKKWDNHEFTEQDKENLFNRLKKVSELFGLKISIEDCKYLNNSSVNIQDEEIRFSPDVNLSYNTIAELHREVIDNIDSYHSDLSKSDTFNLPFFILAFLHEVSHLLTIKKEESRKFRTMYYEDWYSRYGNYRQIPTEKLADNLAYELYYRNQHAIVDILLGKGIEIDADAVKRNQVLAHELKLIYLS